MRRIALLLLVSIICSAYPLRAQQWIEAGATFDTSATPNKSVYGSYLRRLPAGFKSYTTFAFWRAGMNQIAHSQVTGIERALFSQGWFALSGHAQGGVATGASAFSGAFSGGGAVLLSPRAWKGATIVITGSATDVPATGAWYPRVSVGVRYAIVPFIP